MRQDKLLNSPMDRVEPPRPERKEASYYRPEELKKLYTLGGENVVVNNLLVAVHGGFRPGGANDVVHPALQPVAQGQVVLGGSQLLLPVGCCLIIPHIGAQEKLVVFFYKIRHISQFT